MHTTKIGPLDARIQGVKEFNETFQHKSEPQPVTADWLKSEEGKKYVAARVAYIKSEIEELEKAASEGDIVGVLDALVDIDYFNLGTAVGLGVATKFQPAFDLVQAANMSKRCVSEEEVLATQAKLLSEGTETYVEVCPGGWVVKDSVRNKVQKPIYFTPPDLSVLFAKIVVNNRNYPVGEE